MMSPFPICILNGGTILVGSLTSSTTVSTVGKDKYFSGSHLTLQLLGGNICFTQNNVKLILVEIMSESFSGQDFHPLPLSSTSSFVNTRIA
ncbi:unnamed protein product [Cuscuta campestris]|uniref:Uncharacterized protein n=1 Tax=Cuscuta campestris TaxID=132261 RepID=A0A484KHX4_9ASTE|nr:unnamed protein product [Cuscuta campestris]